MFGTNFKGTALFGGTLTKTIMTKKEHQIANFIIEQKMFLQRLNLPQDLFDGLIREQFKKQK